MLLFSNLTCFVKPTQGTTQDKKCVCERTIAKVQNTVYQYCFFYISLYGNFVAATRTIIRLFEFDIFIRSKRLIMSFDLRLFSGKLKTCRQELQLEPLEVAERAGLSLDRLIDLEFRCVGL